MVAGAALALVAVIAVLVDGSAAGLLFTRPFWVDEMHTALLVERASPFDVVREAFGVRWRLGYETIIAAHALFNISLVMLLVRARLSGMDRTHVEASFDLYGTPWRTFWQITFPQLLPAVVAGFLLSFTFSFDDYVITYFVSGAGTTTLPLYVFSTIRKGVTPGERVVTFGSFFIDADHKLKGF